MPLSVAYHCFSTTFYIQNSVLGNTLLKFTVFYWRSSHRPPTNPMEIRSNWVYELSTDDTASNTN